MPDNAPLILVCQDADAELMTEGSTFDHSCVKCGSRVMLARTGARFLIENPDAQIWCTSCVVNAVLSAEVVPSVQGFAGSPEEIREEMSNVRPNLRRQRN